MDLTIQEVSDFLIAAGAVGTAAMGIVEGAKSVRFPPIGFGFLLKQLQWSFSALQVAYGDQYKKLIESLYRISGSGDLARTLRQGIRIGLNEENAADLSQNILGKSDGTLTEIAKKINTGENLEPQEKNFLSRFELAVDARIEGALALGERAYANGIRLCAFIVAIGLAQAAALLLKLQDGFITALIVGLIAVPIAPIAKDIVKGFQSAATALSARSK